MSELFVVKTLEEAKEWFEQHPGEPVNFEPRLGTRKVVGNMAEVEALVEYFKQSIPSTNEIIQFIHCGLCIKERPNNVSPRDWSQLEVGWTPHGLQVWCRRHEANVCHVDFEGVQHPANTRIHQSIQF